MSWAELLALIERECGAEIAAHIEESARIRMGGERITIGKRRPLTLAIIEAAAPGQPKKAAEKLGVHAATVYRRLSKPIIR